MASIQLTYTFESHDELLAHLNGVAANTAPTGATKPAKTPAAAPAKAEKPVAPPAKTGDEVTAIINEVKAKHGTPAAKAIIAAVGFAKLQDLITDGSKNNDAYTLAAAKLAEPVADEGV